MQVRVLPHASEWAAAFAEEAERVAAALGGCVVAVHHIGSTAIPGIYAKPILDLLVEVTDPAAADAGNIGCMRPDVLKAPSLGKACKSHLVLLSMGYAPISSSRRDELHADAARNGAHHVSSRSAA